MDHTSQNITDINESGLKEDDFKTIYKLLDTNICDFDCGALCGMENGGVPFCCEQNVVIPVLYLKEYTYLKKHSDMWYPFKPKNRADQKLMDSGGYDDVLAICKGHLHCKRDYRSFVCRTFPFYPYIEKNGNFVGLTYNYDFENKCVLVSQPNLVSNEYLISSMKAWSYIFDIDDAEYQSHYAMSRDIEKKRRRNRKIMHIVTPNGVRFYE